MDGATMAATATDDATADGSGRTPAPGYRSALSHRDFRLMVSAFAVTGVGLWGYNIALWVWIYDQTGSPAWVAAASLGRFVPALLFSAYGGVLADRFERTRVMRVGDAIAMLSMALLGATAALDGPVVVGIVFASLTSLTGTANDPATQAMVPQVVGEDDLAAANALYSMVDNVAVIAGPAVGTALLLLGSPASVFAITAATFGVSVLLVSRMEARSEPVDVTDGGQAGAWAQLQVGVRAIWASSTARALVSFSVLGMLVYGADTVLLVVLTEEGLGRSSSDVGYLLAGLGIGGLLAAGLVNRLASQRRLGLVLTAGLTLWCLPLAVLVVVDDLRVAVALQVVRGAGTLVVDVLAITALQRSLPSDVLARVLGAFRGLLLAAVSLGALLTPVLLGAVGLSGTLLFFGVGGSVVAVLLAPTVRRSDREASQRVAALEPRIAVLERLGIFAAAPRPVLEQLAGAIVVESVPTGTAVIVEGEPADAMYVLAQGRLEVSAGVPGVETRHLATLEAPSYVGEIGLLEQVPRTATVATSAASELWRIDGDELLAALTAAPPAAAFLETARRRHVGAVPSRAEASTVPSRGTDDPSRGADDPSRGADDPSAGTGGSGSAAG
jgi:CRP-like cAMP-binding protein/predicted MFS family arabinose efflux permease